MLFPIFYSFLLCLLSWHILTYFIGFGNFHYYILFICGSLFAAVAISVSSVSFVVPSAQCDFQMTSVRKGILNGASMIGTYILSLQWWKLFIQCLVYFRNVHGIFYLGLRCWFQRQKICLDIEYDDGWRFQYHIQCISDLPGVYILPTDEWIWVNQT